MAPPTLAASRPLSAVSTADADSATQASKTGNTDRLLSALRELFTCTRKVRSWVADAGAMTVLGVVDECGEARVSDVASALLMDVSTVSRSLRALAKDGLVQWRPDEKDLRSHLVSCTAAGRTRLAERRKQLESELAARLSGWPETDVD